MLWAGKEGGTMPAVANAADEVLVQAFLAERIPFTAIAQGIQHVLERHRKEVVTSLEDVLSADRWARGEAQRFVDSLSWRT